MTFQKLFRALQSAKVEYCVIGRTAAVYYGLNVVTMDVDIILALVPGNSLRFFKALKQLRAISDLPAKMEMDLFETQKVTRFKIGDLAIDVLKWQEGFSNASWPRVKKVRYRGVTVRIAHLHDLIETKSHTGRRKDRADVRRLQKILDQEENPAPRRRKGFAR
jgi:hypothetical protein